jgi:preprotein translocase subunit SecY
MWTERLAHLQYILIWVLLIVGILLFLGIIFLASIRAALAVLRDHFRAQRAMRGRYPLLVFISDH